MNGAENFALGDRQNYNTRILVDYADSLLFFSALNTVFVRDANVVDEGGDFCHTKLSGGGAVT